MKKQTVGTSNSPTSHAYHDDENDSLSELIHWLYLTPRGAKIWMIILRRELQNFHQYAHPDE